MVVMIEKGFQHFKQMFLVTQNNASEPIISLFVSLVADMERFIFVLQMDMR